jgi:hypothetical protein
MVASSVVLVKSLCKRALGETVAQGLPFAIKRETSRRVPFIFVNAALARYGFVEA